MYQAIKCGKSSLFSFKIEDKNEIDIWYEMKAICTFGLVDTINA